MKMNVDFILETFARNQVDAILIGGMNFLLRHQPVLTFDVDFWVRDSEENLSKVSSVLGDLKAQWGRDDISWKPVAAGYSWLKAQSVFCLTSPYGAIDIFREVSGLEGQYESCLLRSTECFTTTGIPYRSLSNEDMLTCQMALPEPLRRLDRVAYLKRILEGSS